MKKSKRLLWRHFSQDPTLQRTLPHERIVLPPHHNVVPSAPPGEVDDDGCRLMWIEQGITRVSMRVEIQHVRRRRPKSK